MYPALTSIRSRNFRMVILRLKVERKTIRVKDSQDYLQLLMPLC